VPAQLQNPHNINPTQINCDFIGCFAALPFHNFVLSEHIYVSKVIVRLNACI